MTEILKNGKPHKYFPNFWKNAHLMGELPCTIRYSGDEEDKTSESTIAKLIGEEFIDVAYDTIWVDVCPSTKIPKATCQAVCNDILDMMGFKSVNPELEPNATVEFIEGLYYHLKLDGNHDPSNEVLNIWIWMKTVNENAFTVSITTQEKADSQIIEKQLPQWEICKIMLKNGVYIFS